MDKHCKDCNQACDPCKKQIKMYYCGEDVNCLDITHGDELSSAIKKIGDKVCQMITEASPLTYVNIQDATLEDCPFGGFVFQILQVGTDNVVATETLCNGIPDAPTDGNQYARKDGNWEIVENSSVTDIPITTTLLATVSALSFNPFYDNGIDGVGATWTATENGRLRDSSGVGMIDGSSDFEVGDWIMLKNEINPEHNGIAEIIDTGSPDTPYILGRPSDYDEGSEFYPLQVNVILGTTNGDKIFLQQTEDVIIGTSDIIFELVATPNQLLPIRFIDTATSAPLPQYTFNPTTGIFTATLNGYLGSINGLFATSNPNITGGFTTFLVKDESDAQYNGTMRIVSVGGTTFPARWTRLDTQSVQFNYSTRLFIVSKAGSSLYGRQYSVIPNSTPLTTATINTAPIYFAETIDSSPTNGSTKTVSSGGVFTALGTKEDASNKQTDLTASATKFPTVNAVNVGLSTKEPLIASGTISQYWRGDKTWQPLNKSAVGLGNVDNTSDVNKPVSTAQATAIGLKQDTLVSGTTIKTVNGNSLLGSGNIVLGSGLTIGTTSITSGTIGRLLFQGAGDVVQQDSNLFWDNINKRLGIGATPNSSTLLDLRAQGALSSDTIFRVRNSANTNDIFSIRGEESLFIGNTTGARIEFTKQTGSVRKQSFLDAFDSEVINLDSLNRSVSVTGALGRIVIGDGVSSGARFGIIGLGSNQFRFQSLNAFGEESLSLRVNQGTLVSNFIFRDNNSTLTQAMNNTFQISNINDTYFGFVASNKGNIAIGGNSHPTVGRSTFSIFNGVEPTSTVADSFIAFSKDIVAGNAVPHFRTENGDIIRLYKETTSVGSATVVSVGAGSVVKTDDTFDGYTIAQIAKTLRNLGILA